MLLHFELSMSKRMMWTGGNISPREQATGWMVIDTNGIRNIEEQCQATLSTG